MGNEISLEGFSFHDASLVGTEYDGRTVVLAIEYYDDDDREVAARAIIGGVETLWCDGKKLDTFDMETADGEIYRLSREERQVSMIVFWRERPGVDQVIRTYTLNGSRLEMRLEAA